MKHMPICILALFIAVSIAGCNKEFQVTGISPVSGMRTGGEPIVIKGSGFEPGMGITVRFGNTEASAVVVNSSAKMTVTTPSSDQNGFVDVFISTDQGKEFVMRKAFRYVEQSAMDIRNLGKRKSRREKTGD